MEMIVAVDPVVGKSSIELEVNPALRGHLAVLAGGRRPEQWIAFLERHPAPRR